MNEEIVCEGNLNEKPKSERVEELQKMLDNLQKHLGNLHVAMDQTRRDIEKYKHIQNLASKSKEQK